MPYKVILVTGGCGFIGSTFCANMKRDYPTIRVIAIDNFVRNGSRLNQARLLAIGIEVVELDIRDREKLLAIPECDLIIDCAAEPSVIAGLDTPLYITDVNLSGTLNCLELARRHNAAFIFLSTSRVYPIDLLRQVSLIETADTFMAADTQAIDGVSMRGVSERLSLSPEYTRTLYGSTKLACEYVIREFMSLYGIKGVINRCGVIAGPWQFGKTDQGIVALWMAAHINQKSLSYIGFGGTGKQVRDILHVDDLYTALKIEIESIDTHTGEIYNIGGGFSNAISLSIMTSICRKITGTTLFISYKTEERTGDIPWYITDHSKFTQATGWKPTKDPTSIFKDVHTWILENKESLREIF